MKSIPNSLSPVRPALPVAQYIGGKRNLAKRICTCINVVPHQLYAEPFVGMGGVFFRRSFRPKAEVINDLSRDVSNLFRILQRHYPQFMDMLKYQLTTRSEFERLNRTDPDTLTDLERAARFLYLQRTAFGGRVESRHFGTSPGYPARFDLNKLSSMLEDAHERLSGVNIECLPYDDFILKYDRAFTLFYLDPPYFSNETDYGKGIFTPDDFERLADILANIKGRFIMSLNDTPETRNIFSAFKMETVQTTYSINKTKSKKAGELIIMNYSGLERE